MLARELQNPLIKKKRVKRPTISVYYRDTGNTLNNGKPHQKHTRHIRHRKAEHTRHTSRILEQHSACKVLSENHRIDLIYHELSQRYARKRRTCSSRTHEQDKSGSYDASCMRIVFELLHTVSGHLHGPQIPLIDSTSKLKPQRGSKMPWHRHRRSGRVDLQFP
jgi:hypothetical protein